ncbi:MAG: hypothetical protein JRI97_09360 [Deltaproteobacteria bacterium]|nr:hypothetical protein [Deltaproteobacteria bacterium]
MENEGSLVIVTGCYGSGKTEYAVNLAAAGEPGRTMLVDLDVVNPYFRSRDLRDEFSARGIDVVAPEGSFSHADVPMLSRRVKGALRNTEKRVIIDVGGDPMGARALARFSGTIKERGYRMRLVVNTRRPQNRTVEEVLDMAARIEAASGLVIQELVANSHLMEETTREVVEEGAAVAGEAARQSGRDFFTVCVLEDLLPRLGEPRVQARIFALKKHLRKPWEPGSGKAWRI